ncbi:MAG TPA: peptidase T [Pirellulales bacterium]|nr:peptidase T [Pirellulales bacterium]
MNSERLLARFLSYVRVDTMAREEAGCYPSSPGQLELGRKLVDELQAIGLTDARADKFGIVLATVPATLAGASSVIALNSHLDTSPETTGAGVNPQVIRDYPGGDIPLAGGAGGVIRVAENPELAKLRGRTIITTDGSTLLGADDKAGLAVIMETAAWLVEHPEIPHGPIRICFTCDEEIGHGVDHVDLAELAAVVGYTLDGQGANEIDVETFSADVVVVRVCGVNIHPSIAKGRMINAARVAGDFLARLPRVTLAPETTAGREGFLHPYVVEGGVAQVTLRVLLRDFETARLDEMAELLGKIAAECEHEHPGARIELGRQMQYRNMREGLLAEPRAVAYAEQALRRLGRTPIRTIVRGGTDGSRLTEIGLPTPNLSVGQHNPHSPLEWACLEEMIAAGEMLVELAQVWAEPGRA